MDFQIGIFVYDYEFHRDDTVSQLSLISILESGCKEAALRNLKTQVDDSFLDGEISFWIRGERLGGMSYATTSLLTTCETLIRFKDYEKDGGANIIFLDYSTDFFILLNEQDCQLKVLDYQYETDEEGFVLSVEQTEIVSERIPKGVFEAEIMKACTDFVSFCEKAQLPVNKDELADIKRYCLRAVNEMRGGM